MGLGLGFQMGLAQVQFPGRDLEGMRLRREQHEQKKQDRFSKALSESKEEYDPDTFADKVKFDQTDFVKEKHSLVGSLKNELTDFYYNLEKEGRLPTVEEKTYWNDRIRTAKESLELGSVYEESYKGLADLISKDNSGMYNKSYASNKLRQGIKRRDDGTIDFSQLNDKDLADFKDDYKIYNPSKVSSDFAKRVEESIVTNIRNNSDGSIDETTEKAKFLKTFTDPNGGVSFRNENGEFEINDSGEAFDMAMKDELMSMQIDGLAQEKGISKREAFSRLVSPQVGLEVRTDRKNIPRAGGRKEDKVDLSLSYGTGEFANTLKDARDNNDIASTSSWTLPIDKVASDVAFDDEFKYDPVEIYRKNGKTYLKASFRTSGDAIQTKDFELNSAIKSKLLNAVKSEKTKDKINELLNEAGKMKEEVVYVDEQKLNETTSRIKTILDEGKSEDEVVQSLTGLLDDLGIKYTSVDADKNSSISNFFGLNEDIEIDGNKFQLAKESDREKLKEYIYDNAKDKSVFATDKKAGSNKITVVTPDGEEALVDDTPENRKLAKEKNYTIK